MMIHPRVSSVWRLRLTFPLYSSRAFTNSSWLLRMTPLVRWWSATNQRRIRFWRRDRRGLATASLLISRYNRPLYHPTACTTHGLEAPGPHTSSERHAPGGV